MKEELLAASALLVQSGAWLVSVNIKLASGLQTVKNLVFGQRYAGWYLQLSYVKPTPCTSSQPSYPGKLFPTLRHCLVVL